MMREINVCPGTLSAGHATYSRTALKRVFNGKLVPHILPFDSPAGIALDENRKWMSISGVQEKYSIRLEKNKLQLVGEGERGSHILKPIPRAGKNADQMPANEHLTMQIARQVFDMETAENALIFFENGEPAYITKRFDVKDNETQTKWAQDDFASLAERTPHTHGAHYKYSGNYLELFQLLNTYVPAYAVEAPKLFRLVVFNYLFSNGDAHLKNFSILETPLGDYRLSPAYDLLNSRIHVDDSDFALADGLLPKALSQGNVRKQLASLGQHAGLAEGTVERIMQTMIQRSEEVEKMVKVSFLSERMKRNYWQAYQGRLNRLRK